MISVEPRSAPSAGGSTGGSADGSASWSTTSSLVACAAALACLLAGYQRLFSTFAPYDDEGYVLLSLEMFSSGYPLYDDTYTQYGPAYYVLVAPLHWLFALPFSHDITRFKTLGVWFLSAVAGGYMVRQLSASLAWGMIAFVLSFLHLERLAMEPGHPQEICILALSAIFYLIVNLRSEHVNGGNRWCCLGLGLAVATAAMAKVNIGALLGLSVAWGLTLLAPRGRCRSILVALVAVASALLPFLLAKHHAASWKGLQLPAIVLASLLGFLVFQNRSPANRVVRWRDSFWFFAGLTAAVVCFSAAVLSHGTSWHGLLHGIIFQHLQFVETFYEHPPVFQAALPCGCLALVAAVVLYGPASSLSRNVYRGLALAAIALLLAVVVRHFSETFQPLRHGANDRGMAAMMLSYATAFCWLIVGAPTAKMTSLAAPAASDVRNHGRWALVAFAFLQPLAIYPVPGTQTAIGSWPTVLCLLVFAADVLADRSLWQSQSDRWLARAARPALLGSVLTVLAIRDLHLTRTRDQLQPLDLPGADRLRLPADLVAKQHWMVAQIQGRARSFVCLPSGYNSLYFWTRMSPPTALNTTMWPDLLNSQEQQRVITALESRRDVCVLCETTEPPAVRRDAPLELYLRREFHSVARHGTVELWERRTEDARMP